MRTLTPILITLGIIFSFTSPLYASLFDELSGDKQQEVLTKLKDHMPNMINDDGLQKYAQYMTDNIPDFAKNLGELSGGNYTPIITQSLTLGGDYLADYYKKTLPEGLSQNAFGYIYSNAGSLRNIGLAMMNENNGWGDVGDVLWNEVKTSLLKDLNKWAEDGVKDTLNWVAGDKKLLGFGAADLYIMFIQAEIAIIDAKIKQFNIKTTNEFYKPYYDARNKGIGHHQAFEEEVYAKFYANDKNMDNGLISGLTVKGFYSFRKMSEEDVSKLFERCYKNEQSSDLYRFVQRESEVGTSQVKKELANDLTKPGDKFRDDINGFYAEVRNKLNELVGIEIDELTQKRDEEIEADEELNKRYETAIEKAGLLLDKIEIDDEKRQPACEGFKKFKDEKYEALDIADQSKDTIKKFELIIKYLSQCPEITRESEGIKDDFKTLEILFTKSKQRWKKLIQDVTGVCKRANSVKKTENRGKAQQALNATKNLGRSAEQNAREVLTLEIEVDKQLGALSKRIVSFHRKYKETSNSIEDNLDAKIQEAKKLEDVLTGLEGAEKKFNNAIKHIRSDRTKAANLSFNIDKNYIEINSILNDGTYADTVTSGGLLSGSTTIAGAFKWASKARDLLAVAKKKQQHLSNCDQAIQEDVAEKRDKLTASSSLGKYFRDLVYSGSSDQNNNKKDTFDKWPGPDIQDIKKRYQLVSSKCKYTQKTINSVEMLQVLSDFQKKQIGADQVISKQKQIKICVDAAQAIFDRKFSKNDKQTNKKPTPDRQSKVREAERLCEKQLPGSIPILDNHGSPTNNCNCQDGSITYNQKCVACTDLKQRFNKAVKTKKPDDAQKILENAFQCQWVRDRENTGALTDEERCPDRNTVYLSDEDNNAQCVPCDDLEADFDNSLKNNEIDYAETLVSLAKKCKWTKGAASKIKKQKALKDCQQILPGSVAVRSGGQDTCRCPTNAVKLSAASNQNMCVPCEILKNDFNSAYNQGDLEYADTILDLASKCSWVPGARKKIHNAATCPSGTIKLSNDSGKNQCVSCQTLYKDFDATVNQGDLEYAETLLELAGECGWVPGGKKTLRDARKCPDNTVKLSDDNNQIQCVPCKTLHSDYTVAKGQGESKYAASLLDLASDCKWTKQASQQVRNQQLQTELNNKCNQQMSGSHAVINGDRYNCYCNDGMIELTYSNGNKSCQSCQQIGDMVNAALKQNNINSVKGLIPGAKHCGWYDQAVNIIAGMENNSQPPRQPNQQQTGPLTGTWDMYWKDLDPYYGPDHYNIDGSFSSKGMTLDFTGHKGTIILTQSGNSIRGRWQGDGATAPVDGNVKGNNVRFCLITPDEKHCVPLTINFSNMTMSGLAKNRHGEEDIRWTLKKRR